MKVGLEVSFERVEKGKVPVLSVFHCFKHPLIVQVRGTMLLSLPLKTLGLISTVQVHHRSREFKTSLIHDNSTQLSSAFQRLIFAQDNLYPHSTNGIFD